MPLVTLGRPVLHVPVEGSLRSEARSGMLRASHSTLALVIPPPCSYDIKRATRTSSRRLWECYVTAARGDRQRAIQSVLFLSSYPENISLSSPPEFFTQIDSPK